MQLPDPVLCGRACGELLVMGNDYVADTVLQYSALPWQSWICEIQCWHAYFTPLILCHFRCYNLYLITTSTL